MNRSALFALSLAISAGTAAATTLNNSASWTGGGWAPFGFPDTSTYGQVFTAPAGDNVINDYSFLVSAPQAVTGVTSYIYAWNGSTATGPALFSTGPFTLAASSGFVYRTINTGGVELTSGSQYIAFYTISENYGGNGGSARFGYAPGGGLGGFAYQNNLSNFGWLFGNNWAFFRDQDLDTVFIANFTPTPGAAGLLGMAGLMAVRRRR